MNRMQEELRRCSQTIFQERERKQQLLNEAERKKREEKDDAYKHRAEVRDWIALSLSALAILLSLFSILWQSPLH